MEAIVQSHRGPNLMAVGSVFSSLFLASLIAVAILSGGGHIPSPWEEPLDSAKFFDANTSALRLSAFLQFGAMIPLAIYAATAESRLRFLGVRAAGPTLGLVGGVLAATMGGLSGLAQWMITQPGVANTRVLHLFAFATGGPGFVVPFGILVAGFAVSGGLSGHLPRWLMWSGIGVALIAELSSLTLIAPPAMYLLPVARFLGLAWLVAAGAKLAKYRS